MTKSTLEKMPTIDNTMQRQNKSIHPHDFDVSTINEPVKSKEGVKQLPSNPPGTLLKGPSGNPPSQQGQPVEDRPQTNAA